MDHLLSMSMEDLLSLKVRISTNTEQSLSKAPSVVTVLTREDFRATGAVNLAEILQGVPGIYVRSNLFGFRPHITFRGADSNQTLLMLNGEPVRDLVWSSGIFWRGLPVSMIERVEIIRGPGSALFGSDASAGAINIITRSAGRIDRTEAGVRAGSFDSQGVWARHGWEWGAWDLGMTLDLTRTDGHAPRIVRDAQSASDATWGTGVSHAPDRARYGWQGRDLHFSAAREHWRLLADYSGVADVEIGLTGAGVLDPATQGQHDRFDLGLFYANPNYAPDWGVNAEVRHHRLEYSSGNGFQERPPGYANASGLYPDGWINRIRSTESGWGMELSGSYDGIRRHALRVGAGFNTRSLISVEQQVNFGTGPDGNPIPAGSPLLDLTDTPWVFVPEKTRTIQYLFVQDIWTLAHDWELTAGARYDHYSDFGDTINPRAALVWQSTDRLSTKLMYGRAFRAPSFLQLHARTSANIPNPDLQPETSSTWDLSMTYTAARNLKLAMTLYRFEQSDLIAANAATGYQFRNLGQRTSRGGEWEMQWQANPALRLSGNYSRIWEEAATFPASLPRDKCYLRLDWTPAPGWNWNLQALRVGERRLPAGDPRAPLPAYTLVDTTLRHAPAKDWEIAISARNLFDRDAREYSSSALTDNLPLPGRAVYLEIQHKL